MTGTPTEEQPIEQDRFTDSPISRRAFTRLAAITGGAIALPGVAAGGVSSAKLTEFYEFVVIHTPDDYAVSTLIRLENASGFEDLRAAGIDVRTTTDPEPAAYAELTASDVETVVGLESVTRLQFTHGANPFWRLEGYPDGVVFPDAMESVDHIGYEEAVAGLNHLADRHSDRMRAYPIGESPGFYNHYLEETDGEDVWIAEITNDVRDEETFQEKTKAMSVLSIHGDERAGVEGGARFIEGLLTGEHPDVEAVLDDVALVFVFPNPDGWLLGEPQYTRTADDSIEAYLDQKTRGNAGVGDTNRQYPTLGWISPSNYPSEPDGANLVDDEPGIDADVPPEIAENMPDGLAIAEHVRSYQNLEYCVDLHNMGWPETYCYGFVINGEYDLEHLNAAYELNRRIKPQFDERVGPLLEERRQAILDFLDEDESSDVATVPFEYGTLLSTLGYTTTGSLMGWMSQSSEMGGLDVKTMAYELPSVDPAVPELIDINVTAYTIVLRELARHATRDVDVDVETNGTRTAYVTSDALTRTSESLSFVGAESDRTRTTVTVDRDAETVTTEVAPGTNSVSFTLDPEIDYLKATLRDPDGSVVARANQLREQRERVEWFIAEPTPGEWTIELQNLKGTDRNAVVVTVDTVLSEGSGVETPDPRDVLGYEQRTYESTPFDFFEDYVDVVGTDGRSNRARGRNGGNGRGRTGNTVVDPISVADVRNGALFEGNSDTLAYDNLVVIHTDGKGDEAYVDALDRFVDAGGNVVLTDTGVELLSSMDNDLVSEFSAAAITEQEVYVAQLTEKNLEHPLLSGTREIQRELWKPSPLGYPGDFSGASPMTVIDPEAFESASGTVAGYCHENVFAPVPDDPPAVVGSITNGREVGAVHVIGSLLPPATQTQLHPFGMEDYTASFFGQTLLMNALGHRQRRLVNGEEVPTSDD
ncbi:M14 family zinc carboxypeptidase [Saliphagus sp. GCM10025334]